MGVVKIPMMIAFSMDSSGVDKFPSLDFPERSPNSSTKLLSAQPNLMVLASVVRGSHKPSTLD